MIEDFVVESDSVSEEHIEKIIDFASQYLDIQKGEISKGGDELFQSKGSRKIKYNALTL
jgi:hypothetical protein